MVQVVRKVLSRYLLSNFQNLHKMCLLLSQIVRRLSESTTTFLKGRNKIFIKPILKKTTALKRNQAGKQYLQENRLLL